MPFFLFSLISNTEESWPDGGAIVVFSVSLWVSLSPFLSLSQCLSLSLFYSVCACVFVCVFMSASLCLTMCVCECVCVCLCVCLCVGVWVCAHSCGCTWVYVCLCDMCLTYHVYQECVGRHIRTNDILSSSLSSLLFEIRVLNQKLEILSWLARKI